MPVGPRTPVACASSRSRSAECVSQVLRISTSGHRSPSMENTDSVTTSILPIRSDERIFAKTRSRASVSLCGKTRNFAPDVRVASIRHAWARRSTTTKSPLPTITGIADSAAVYPEGKMSAASLFLAAAIVFSNKTCGSGGSCYQTRSTGPDAEFGDSLRVCRKDFGMPRETEVVIGSKVPHFPAVAADSHPTCGHARDGSAKEILFRESIKLLAGCHPISSALRRARYGAYRLLVRYAHFIPLRVFRPPNASVFPSRTKCSEYLILEPHR